MLLLVCIMMQSVLRAVHTDVKGNVRIVECGHFNKTSPQSLWMAKTNSADKTKLLACDQTPYLNWQLKCNADGFLWKCMFRPSKAPNKV